MADGSSAHRMAGDRFDPNQMIDHTRKNDAMISTTLNYIELPATDLAATKTFYETNFGWTFAHDRGRCRDRCGPGAENRSGNTQWGILVAPSTRRRLPNLYRWHRGRSSLDARRDVT